MTSGAPAPGPASAPALRLLWKDLVAARWLLLAGLPIYALNLGAMTAFPPAFAMTALIVSSILAFGSLAIEEIQGTRSLWASLPVRRRDLVRGRYGTALFGALLGLGVSFGVERLATTVRLVTDRPASPTLEASITLHALLLLVVLWMAAALLPLCFRLGTGNGALTFAAVSFGVILLISFGAQAVFELVGATNPFLDPGFWSGAPTSEEGRALRGWLDRWQRTVLVGAAVVTAAALWLSARLSQKFYSGRDLVA